MEQLIPKLSVKNIQKTFFDKKGCFTAIEDVSFEVYDNEFLVLLGPGNCGKTVLLNIIAGLLEPTSGQILVDGKVKENITSDIGMIFQKLAIFPFKTVLENVELGAKFAGENKKSYRERALHYIELVGLKGFEKSYPHELSGGMKQRVGIARAYTTNPSILLMDEPFGQLDAQTRYAMEEEILRICSTEKKVVIFVTNNIEEACYLGDRIILFSERPEKVKETYVVDIPKPRNMTSPEFLKLRKTISDNTDLDI